jgi:hypothetical protein
MRGKKRQQIDKVMTDEIHMQAITRKKRKD